MGVTAINVIQRPHAVHMLTDGAAYLPDGTLGLATQKVVAVAHLSAAFSARGPRLFMPLVGEHIAGAFKSFDEMVEGIIEVVRAASRDYLPLFDLCAHGPTFQMVIAGWSTARRKPETYVLTDNGEKLGIPSWKLQPFGALLVMPWDEDTAARIRLTKEEMAGRLDPVRDGLRILEAQRFAKAIQGRETEAAHGVGGFAQLTTITAENITTRILKRWPDLVGEKLDPERVIQ
jgi:hypothetical protein